MTAYATRRRNRLAKEADYWASALARFGWCYGWKHPHTVGVKQHLAWVCHQLRPLTRADVAARKAATS